MGQQIIIGTTAPETFSFWAGDSSLAEPDRIVDFQRGEPGDATDLIALTEAAPGATSGTFGGKPLVFRGRLPDGFVYAAGSALPGEDLGPGFAQVWWTRVGTGADVRTVLIIDSDSMLDPGDFVVELAGSSPPDLLARDFAPGTFRVVVGTPDPDNLTGTSEADTIYGLAGADRLVGGGGDDTLDGGDGADTLIGDHEDRGIGNDLLRGGGGDDTLQGGAGADTLIGGSGADVLTGGSGADLFSFWEGDSSIHGPDRITDFSRLAGDRIGLVGTAGIVDGTFGGKPLVFRGQLPSGYTHELGANLPGADLGPGFAQVWWARVGPEGNARTVLIVDGNGVLDLSDLVIELEGTALTNVLASDFVVGSFRVLLGTTGPDSLEGTGGSDTIYSLDGDDRIADLGGDDRVMAGAGDDTLIASAGNDSLEGGDGLDTFDASSIGLAVTVDLAGGIATGSAIGRDTLSGIENAIGGLGGDTLVGDDAANRLDGGYGADVIAGGAGADALLGGGGNDTLRGGLDGDILTGGTGSDLFQFWTGDSTLAAPDQVTDFRRAEGDKIGLLDLVDGAFGGKTLVFGGELPANFVLADGAALPVPESGVAQVWWKREGDGVARTLIIVDSDGVLDPSDLVIALTGSSEASIRASDIAGEIEARPQARDDSYTVAEDGVLAIPARLGILANDSDDDPLTAVLVSGPAHGSLALNADGSFTYTPNPDFAGTDAFTYRARDAVTGGLANVTLTVAPVNDAPVALNGNAVGQEDTPLMGQLPAATDIDSPPDTLTYSLVSGSATGGSAVLRPDGSFIFTPAADYAGTASFQYVVLDAAGGTSNIATLSLTIEPVNEAPVANPDSGTVKEDGSVALAVLANDTDPDLLDRFPDALTIGAVSPTRHGATVTVAPDGKSLVYTADPDIFDLLTTLPDGRSLVDTFSYTVRDRAGLISTATVSVTVQAVADTMPVRRGSNANDTLDGTAGEDSIFGGNGADRLSGLAGADILYGENGDDRLSGGSGIDRLEGGNGNDVLDGGTGDDTLLGGNGTDILDGGLGKDELWGGNGGDVFRFTTVSDSPVGAAREVIRDWNHGDLIDLSSIDANPSAKGDQAFTFSGSGVVVGPGQVKVYQAGGSTFVIGSDGTGEFQIEVAGLHILSASSFIL